MRGKYRPHHILEVVLLFIALAGFSANNSKANENSKYLDAVREFADNVLKHGRDTYGPKHTPLFVDGLNIHTHEPVKWIAPSGEKWVLSNLASQQNLFRTLDGLSTITGDPKYKQAAMDAIKYAFENLRSPNGLLYWGGYSAYDAKADKVCGNSRHVLKGHYPYYKLMWDVDPRVTKQFIQSFWSAHVKDWSNLAMDRLSRFDAPIEKAWRHEYEGGPVFLEIGSGISFINAGTDLVCAAAWLTKLSGDREPLVWGRRLARRYVETRHPKTGISYHTYTKRLVKVNESYDDVMRKLVPGTADFLLTDYFPYNLNPILRKRDDGQLMPTPGISVYKHVFYWQSLFLVGMMLDGEGDEFKQWALEELTAFGKASYRKKDNTYVPILTDGTSLEGYVIKETGLLGPKCILEPVPVRHSDLWAYAMGYRVMEDVFMWEMAYSIAKGNEFGDIGATPKSRPQLKTDTECLNPYVLLAFLELHRATCKKDFLEMAKVIGDNILGSRFHKGFFVASNRHIYTKFDAIEALVLLHLHSECAREPTVIPRVWPSVPYFVDSYRNKEEATDNILYTLTESTELPLSLHEAAIIGDINLVSSFLEKGVEVNSWGEVGKKTALQCAAMNGQKDIVELLLAKGARIDAQEDFPGGTALGYAAENGDREIVELLIAKGADVNAKRIKYPAGDTPLHSAVRSGQKDIVELLIANGADVNAKNNEGQTPVDIALSRSRNEVAKLLIAKGADITLHSAVRIGALVKVKSLIEKGTNISEKDASGQTALHYAVEYGHEDVVKLLIANGADVNAKDKDGNAPGHVALKKDRSAVLDLLIAKGANLTSIHLSAYQGDLDKVRSFIEKETDVSAMDSYGATPLHYAAVRGNKEVVEFLIARGADVNAKNKSGETPLHKAAIRGHKDIVKLLIDNAANINATEQRNYTPVHYVVWSWNTETAELLIEKGANVQAKDRWGWTPLHYAAGGDNRVMAQLLIAKGADVNAKDNSGETALSVAKEKGHTEIVELLRKHGAKE